MLVSHINIFIACTDIQMQGEARMRKRERERETENVYRLIRMDEKVLKISPIFFPLALHLLYLVNMAYGEQQQ